MAATASMRPFAQDGPLGQGSGSGAGVWLSQSASNTDLQDEQETKERSSTGGRRYHIAADATKSTTQEANDLFLMINPSDSGDVDLDLSFDFVSQLEKGPTELETPSKNKTVTVMASTPDSESPRGMSAARWGSRSRKQPPSALTLSHKANQLGATAAASQFSPITPLNGGDENEEPIFVTTLGSTRRAADSGIKGEQLYGVNKADLIRQQRSAAQEMQNENKHQRLSPEKRSPNKQIALALRKRLPLSENRNRNNAQMMPSSEQGDVFDDTNYDYKKHLKKSPSQASTWTGGVASSFATANESHGGKSKKSTKPLDSMESINTYGSALSGESDVVGVPIISVDSVMAIDNMLGLQFTDTTLETTIQDISSPVKHSAASLTQVSSPYTPYSPLFSDSGTTKGGESQSEGIATPETAFSTLFDGTIPSLDFKLSESYQMMRGLSAPLSARPIVKDVITEEKGSSLEAHSAPATSFLVDLPAMEDHVADLRERQATNATNSDPGSSPIQGKRTMIVSTMGSPSAETGLLFRRPTQGKPAIPLLLNNFAPEGDLSEDLNSTLGLGIDLGQKETTSPDHFQMDMSELSVERVILPMLDGTEQGLDMGMQSLSEPLSSSKEETISLAPPNKAANVMSSPSFVSSVEGFSINVTPAVQGESPYSSNVVETEAGEGNKLGKSRWSNKLWNFSPLQSFRSPARATFEDNQKPRMKVGEKNGEENEQRNSKTLEDHYHSLPSSALLPTLATFAPLPSPLQVLYGRAQSSKHLSRSSSRLQYVPSEQGDHIQLDMGLSQKVDKTPVIDVSSPLPMAEAYTPKMEYLMKLKTQRHSWDYASTAGHSRAPSWLSPFHLSVNGQGESELLTNMRNSTLSALSPKESYPTTVSHLLDTIGEDGIRRRINHRSTNSVPTTPTMVPDAWTSPPLQSNPAAGMDGHQAGVRFFEQSIQEEDDETASKLAQGRSYNMLSIFGPASASIAPYLKGLTGHRNSTRPTSSVDYDGDAHTQIRIFSDDREQIEGLIAISGRALENASPSKSLFFAGFLGMPWLWFIGGWGLEDDGSVYIDHEFVRQNVDDRDILYPLTVRASGVNLHQSTHSLHRSSMQTRDATDQRYSMGMPESIINMEEEYNEFQRRGKARSVIQLSSPIDGQDWMPRSEVSRKTRSLLEGDERNSFQPPSLTELQRMSHSIVIPFDGQEEQRSYSLDLRQYDAQQQTGFAFSSEGEKNSFTEVPAPAGAFTLPMSQWEDYDDLKKTKKHTFFQQVLEANSSMVNKLKSSPRNKNSLRNNTQSTVSRSFTDWTHLEQFVLWNRIMALIISVVVFGGFAVAIFFVVSDW